MPLCLNQLTHFKAKFIQSHFDVQPYLKTGQLFFIYARDIYIQDGKFDPDRTIEALKSLTMQAVTVEGFSKFRATGEMSWACPWYGCDHCGSEQ